MEKDQDILTLKNVTVKRSGVIHLQDINLCLPLSKHTAVIGENGSGKSTFLDVTSRDINPDAGEIYLLDRQLDSYTLSELARCRAYLRQQQQLSFDLTVKEVVKLGCINASGDVEVTLVEVLDALELKTLQDQQYTSLSGGEQQRVQIGRVLAQCWNGAGQLCLLDEPMSSLDIRHQHLLLGILKTLTKKGLTIISVMHDLELARHAADFLVILKAGKLSSVGHTKEVFRNENIEKAFGISWPIVCPDEKLQT